MIERDTDPLALRHGPLIAQVWGQIAHARQVARLDPDDVKATFWRRRIRHLARKVRAAQRREMARSDLATATIVGWFGPVCETLAKAEAHFSAVLAKRAIDAARSSS